MPANYWNNQPALQSHWPFCNPKRVHISSFPNNWSHHYLIAFKRAPLLLERESSKERRRPPKNYTWFMVLYLQNASKHSDRNITGSQGGLQQKIIQLNFTIEFQECNRHANIFVFSRSRFQLLNDTNVVMNGHHPLTAICWLDNHSILASFFKDTIIGGVAIRRRRYSTTQMETRKKSQFTQTYNTCMQCYLDERFTNQNEAINRIYIGEDP